MRLLNNNALLIAVAALTCTAQAAVVNLGKNQSPDIRPAPAQCVTSHCYTSFGPKSTKHVPTTSNYHTKTVTRKTTTYVHSTVTITRQPSTTTKTVTSTTSATVTASTLTDTVTSTSTVLTTSIITAPTSSATVTATSTVVTSTTTTPTSVVATPSAFVPIQDTLAGSMARKRSLEEAEGRRVRELLKRGSPRPLCSDPKQKYPVAVECEVTTTKTTTRTYTKTASPCTTTVVPPKVTSTSTVVYTTTSTVYPTDVTSIVTTSTTSIVLTTTTPSTTVTTTVTTTSTSTSEAPTATVYAQCAANNFASQGPTAGNYFVNGNPTDSSINYDEPVTNAASALDCCNQCAVYPNCIWSAFLIGTTECVLASIDTCLVGSASDTWQVYTDTTQPTYVFSNGQCGSWVSYENQ